MLPYIPGTDGCKDGQCQCNLGGIRTDGGDIIDDKLLPVTKVKLGPALGSRTLRVGPVKCFGKLDRRRLIM